MNKEKIQRELSNLNSIMSCGDGWDSMNPGLARSEEEKERQRVKKYVLEILLELHE